MNSDADALAQLEPGREVHIRLADGTTVSGRLKEVADHRIELDDGESIPIADVADVGRRVVTEGPE